MSLRGARNTGFPESFDGHRNTCLPHPDAIIAPDATITEADINIARAAARHRMSIQANQARAAATSPDSQHVVIDDNGNSSSNYCASPTAISTSHSHADSRSGNMANDHDHGKSDAESLHSGGSLSPTHPPPRLEATGGKGKKRRRSLLARLTHR
ncbi:hypothetical protein QBC39DRAFT_368374 [Podospora conica]|nr:hypothetical protein QBC39DRAFT_368374 [Schizothecium conicum]